MGPGKAPGKAGAPPAQARPRAPRLTGAVDAAREAVGAQHLLLVLLVDDPALAQIRRELGRVEGARQPVPDALDPLPQRVLLGLGPRAGPGLLLSFPGLSPARHGRVLGVCGPEARRVSKGAPGRRRRPIPPRGAAGVHWPPLRRPAGCPAPRPRDSPRTPPPPRAPGSALGRRLRRRRGAVSAAPPAPPPSARPPGLPGPPHIAAPAGARRPAGRPPARPPHALPPAARPRLPPLPVSRRLWVPAGGVRGPPTPARPPGGAGRDLPARTLPHGAAAHLPGPQPARGHRRTRPPSSVPPAHGAPTQNSPCTRVPHSLHGAPTQCICHTPGHGPICSIS